MNVDGVARRGFIYAPPQPRRHPTPLVLAFHGRGDWVENFQYTNLHLAWPDAIVVYLQGLLGRDGLPGWQVDRGEAGDRDLRLVDAVLASLQQRYAVDPERVYATGFSNGGAFTYLLWAERSRVFAAFAPVAGTLRSALRPAEPRPLLHIGGSADMVVPFADQLKTIDAVKQWHRVSGGGTSCGEGCRAFDSGRAPVMTWLHAGDHEYLDGTSERIAAFFRSQSRPR